MSEKRRLAIWHLQTHKKPCLMILEGNKAVKVASFNNEESADLFCEVVNNLVDEIYEKGKNEA